MSKTPSRTWSLVLSLGLPLSIVGVAAMAISYATLIDVARVNGLPLPELFPILVDVGTVASMIAAAQFRLRGITGRWLAYTTFVLLSCVSIVANATHAWRAADMTVTTPWASAILAATPPAALLAITHLVMMLIPDQKERTKMQTLRERTQAQAQAQKDAAVSASTVSRTALVQQPPRDSESLTPAATSPLRLVTSAQLSPAGQRKPATAEAQSHVRAQVLEFFTSNGEKPTGAVVGEWLGGKSAKTGQRFLAAMEAEGAFDRLARMEVAHV